MSILKKLEFEGGSKQQSISINVGDYPYYIRANDINRILDTTNEIINFVNTINYNSLTNKPTINKIEIKGEISKLLKDTINQYIKNNDIVINWTDITNKSYNDLTNKPTINDNEIKGEISGIIASIIPHAAKKLKTPVTIALDGAIKGSAQFDGSSNISITTALADGIKIDISMIDPDRNNYII
jgi:hypothetical protein